MRLALAEYVCKHCGAEFEAPMISSYGQFLLWSARGTAAYVHSYVDPVFQELEDLIYAQAPELKERGAQAGDVVQHMFGPLACDPDQEGAPFAIDAPPPCPKCGSANVQLRGFLDPPRFAELEIAPVTHARWNRLTEPEKQSAVARGLPEAGIVSRKSK